MATLKSRLGNWELPHVHAWSERAIQIRAPQQTIIGPTSKVVTIGSCFAAELAAVMGKVGLVGGMHPGGLYYSTATIRQELERITGGWPERDAEPVWPVGDGLVDPFRDYATIHPDEAALRASRAAADSAADELFRDARVVVVTLGLIETFRSSDTGNTYRQIPHPAAYPTLGADFHRLTVAEMLDDMEVIRRIVRETMGADLVITTSPVPLHTTFTPLDVRVANTESKSRIRAAVSEFIDSHPDVHYFHSYEMVVTAERQSDFFREDGRHVHRHAVRYIVAEFLRLYADQVLHVTDVDDAWLTPISKTAESVAPRPAAGAGTTAPKPARPPVSLPRRVARKVRRQLRSLAGRG